MTILKNILKILLSCALPLAGFYIWINGAGAILLGGDWLGYSWFPIAILTLSLILLCVFLYNLMWNIKKVKLTAILCISSLILLGLTFGGNAVYRNYRQSLKLNEEVDLVQYAPSIEPTLLAELDSESELKLTVELPRLNGATALYPLYSAFARATYPQKEYDLKSSEVQCSNTVGAYTALFKGESNIIFVASPSKEQKEFAENFGIDLYMTPIGREAFVFFTNSRNKVDNLTIEQLQGIYSGKTTDWEELGGGKGEIVAYQRPEGSGSQSTFLKLMEGVELASPPKDRVVGGMGGIVEQVADYENSSNAIGYSFLYYTTRMKGSSKIKLLSVNGITPTKETIQNGEYPYIGDFYAITIGEPTGNSKVLIDWILSPQGQELIEKTGYVGIK